MRILMTTDTVGGVWTFTKELSVELLAHGCAVALMSLGRMPSQAQQAWADAQEDRWGSRFRFVATDVPLEWMAENARAFREAAPLLLNLAHEFGAELLLSSQFCFGALRGNLPRIVVAHSDVLSWAEACRPQGLPPSAWLNLYCELVARGLRDADAVVAPTRWMLNALAKHFSLRMEQAVIANGRTVPPVMVRCDRGLQAVTAGRLWDEAKNVRMLRNVNSPMPVVIAGEMGHESACFDSDWKQVTLLGPLDEVALLGLFQRSAIYVCTSKYEPFGLAPLEAALCGCAVVANDIPSLREVWGDGALYFNGADSLTELLGTLSGDQEFLKKAQERSTERARSFTAKRMAAEYLQLVRTVAQRNLTSSHVA